jgi:hypothetical protein
LKEDPVQDPTQKETQQEEFFPLDKKNRILPLVFSLPLGIWKLPLLKRSNDAIMTITITKKSVAFVSRMIIPNT